MKYFVIIYYLTIVKTNYKDTVINGNNDRMLEYHNVIIKDIIPVPDYGDSILNKKRAYNFYEYMLLKKGTDWKGGNINKVKIDSIR